MSRAPEETKPFQTLEVTQSGFIAVDETHDSPAVEVAPNQIDEQRKADSGSPDPKWNISQSSAPSQSAINFERLFQDEPIPSDSETQVFDTCNLELRSLKLLREEELRKIHEGLARNLIQLIEINNVRGKYNIQILDKDANFVNKFLDITLREIDNRGILISTKQIVLSWGETPLCSLVSPQEIKIALLYPTSEDPLELLTLIDKPLQ